MRAKLTHLVLLAALAAATLPACAAEEEAAGQELGPAVGADAPAFTLEAVDGEKVSLADFRGESPVVLVFFRGEW